MDINYDSCVERIYDDINNFNKNEKEKILNEISDAYSYERNNKQNISEKREMLETKMKIDTCIFYSNFIEHINQTHNLHLSDAQ